MLFRSYIQILIRPYNIFNKNWWEFNGDFPKRPKLSLYPISTVYDIPTYLAYFINSIIEYAESEFCRSFEFVIRKFIVVYMNTSAIRDLLFTLYLYSGLRSSVWEKITSDNWNLRNLRHNEEKFSRDVGINKIEISSNYIRLP